MRSSWMAALLFGAPLLPKVLGHGFVQGIVADGVYYSGYDADFQYHPDAPETPAWQDPTNENLGPVGLGDYANPNIICSIAATNGKIYATVAAGGQVTLQWSKWPASHHGPIIDYLASCNGDCTTVDKMTLLFNKIDAAGLVDGNKNPATFATDTMIANNNSWTMTIPASIAPGNYVLRHEIIALHLADKPDMAENYPQCVNLKITGGGTNALAGGTAGTQLYKTTDPGLNTNLYNPPLASYPMPGPPMMVDGPEDNTESIPTTMVKMVKREVVNNGGGVRTAQARLLWNCV